MKKTVIVSSLNDSAGSNIRERLIEEFGFEETTDLFDFSPVYQRNSVFLASSHKDIVYVDDLDAHFENCRYVFLSRHRSESGIPSLTVHLTGNFGSNDFGGNPREISHYSPSMLKNYFLELESRRREINKKYSLTIEATHHGPTSLTHPVLFVELGSSHEQWTDSEAARVIAHALMSSIASSRTYSRCAIGLGGTHYPDKFNKFLLEEQDFSLGVVVPKYSVHLLNDSLLEQTIQKCEQKVRYALVDNKGLGKFKPYVLKLLEGHGLEVIRK